MSSPWGVWGDTLGNVYWSEYSAGLVRRAAAGTRIVSTVSGRGSGDDGVASNAALSYPRGIFGDSAGGLYVAQYDMYRVRRLSTDAGTLASVPGQYLGEKLSF